MKKNSIVKQSRKRTTPPTPGPLTVGLDVGDKTTRCCVLGCDGEVLAEGSVPTTKKAMTQKFSVMPRCRVAVEVRTHSPWLSRVLTSVGFEFIVANARQLPLISAS